MKLKNYTLSINLLKVLLDSNVHIGSIKSNLTKDFYFYLYGFREKTSIINLKYTFKTLKKLSFFLIFLLKNQKKIVFVGFPNWFNKKWKFLEQKSKKNYFFLEYDWKNNFLLNNYEKIGLIFLFDNYSKKKELIKEIKKLNIPLAGFTSSTSNNFDFPIIGNFHSKKSILFFYYFLLNILVIKKN